MDLKDVDYVLAVAHYRNISQAAQSLYVSQPALSKYISTLEARMGMPLFIRSSKGLGLTLAGEIYVRHAKEIAASAELLRQELKQLTTAQGDHLSVGVARSGWQRLLPEVFNRLTERYPSATFEFPDLLASELEDSLLAGMFDIGLCSVPPHKQGLDYKVIENYYRAC